MRRLCWPWPSPWLRWCSWRRAPRPRTEPRDPATTTTPIKHVVLLMQDNHSFDNYFGTYPGADGIPAGVCQRLELTADHDHAGASSRSASGATTPEDLSQGVGVQKRQYDGGRMDGFVAAYRRLGLDGTTAMGYYDGRDIPYYWNVAKQYVLFDRFFSSTAVGSRRELPVLGGRQRTTEPERR